MAFAVSPIAVNVSDGVTATFAIPFPYMDQGDVYVYVNEVPFAGTVTWTNSSTISLSPVPAAGVEVMRRRMTPNLNPKATFVAGALAPVDLNKNQTQCMYLADEAEAWASYVDSGSLKVPVNEASQTIPSVANRGGKLLGFDLSGNIRMEELASLSGKALYVDANGRLAGTSVYSSIPGGSKLDVDLGNVVATTTQKRTFRNTVKGATYYATFAAAAADTHTVGDVIALGEYGGCFATVYSEVILQNHFSGDLLQSSKIAGDDELHRIVNLTAGGTGVLQVNPSSIAEYVRLKLTELKAAQCNRFRRKQVLSGSLTAQVHMYGDSRFWGQTGAELASGSWVDTGYGDGSKHKYAQIASPIPAVLKTFTDAMYGTNKVSVVQKGYSGDRWGSAYVRHRLAGSSHSVSFLCYDTNDVLYGSNNGINPEYLFTGTDGYVFSNLVPAMRLFAYREVLRGAVPIFVCPDVFSSLVGADGTVWSAAKVLPAFTLATKQVAQEMGAYVIDLTECLNGYANSYLYADGVHPNNNGSYVWASRLAAMLGPDMGDMKRITSEMMLRASPIYESMTIPASSASDEMLVIEDTSSLNAPFVDAAKMLSLIVDTDNLFFSVYIDSDELCALPVGYIADGGTATINIDFGVQQPYMKLDTLAAASLGDDIQMVSTVDYVASGGTRVLNNPSKVGSWLTIAGRGPHLFSLRAVNQNLVLSGLYFGRWNRMAAAVTAPTGGATIDTQARAAITSILDAMKLTNITKT